MQLKLRFLLGISIIGVSEPEKVWLKDHFTEITLIEQMHTTRTSPFL